jgi:predicted metal-dependent hydrolase
MEVLSGIELYDARLFWEAHEAWEADWLPLRGTPEASYYKGLIHLTAAMVHLSRGQRRGPRRLLATARQHLAPFLGRPDLLDLPKLDATIEKLQAQIEGEGDFDWPPGPLPRA